MKKINKYIIIETIGPFLAGVLFFTFVFVIQLLPELVRLIVNNGAPLLMSLETFVYMLPSVVLAFEEISPELVLTSRTLGMSRLQIVKMVLLPSTLPSILQTFIMMYGIGWTYIAVCEQINAKYGIGFIIYTSSARGRTAIVFAGIIAIVIFSSLFDFISNKILKRCFKWRYIDAPIE